MRRPRGATNRAREVHLVRLPTNPNIPWRTFLSGRENSEAYLDFFNVDQVIVEAPEKVDLMFLEKFGIDYVVASADQRKFVTDEAIGAERCLTIGEDSVARPSKLKAEDKSD